MADDRLVLREAVSVPDAIHRDALVRRIKAIRDNAVLDKNTVEYWNRMHRDQLPMSTAFEDAVIAWCDGKGPAPLEVPRG